VWADRDGRGGRPRPRAKLSPAPPGLRLMSWVKMSRILGKIRRWRPLPIPPGPPPGSEGNGRAPEPPVVPEPPRPSPTREPLQEPNPRATAETEVMPIVAREQAIDWLHQMLLIRRFEERSAMLYQNQKIGGFCHLYSGQEPVAVGSI